MAEDMISTYIADAPYLISFSVGYFVYDTYDMLKYNRSRQAYELIIHHLIVSTVKFTILYVLFIL